jgi:hypothetical protein
VPYIPVSTVGAVLVEALGPWMTDHFAMYLDAVGVMYDPVATLVQDQGDDGDPGFVPAWGSLFDVNLCPAADLPYLGQFVGVQVPVGAGEATARALVRAESGKNRGTLGSIRSAIERNISAPWQPNTTYLAGVLVTFDPGTGPVFYEVTTGFTSGSTFDATNLTAVDPQGFYRIFERQMQDGTADAYHLTIIVLPEQLTPVNNTVAITAAVLATKPGGIILHLTATDSPRWEDATLTWATVAGTVTWANVSSGSV